MDLAFERVSKVFGLAALSRAVVCEKDFDTICQTTEDYLGSALHGIRTFKVEARRADKTYPMTSPELMRELGAYLLGKHNYLKVDVHNPQFKVIVEIRDYGAYIHGPKIQGEGGLPVGTSGRALNMLSGGIDSPVAAYRMAKRGLGLDHIHFASPPYTSERAKLKVKALAQLITPYTGSTNLFVVPYTKPQEYIRDNAPDVLFTVLMRRSMMRIANVITVPACLGLAVLAVPISRLLYATPATGPAICVLSISVFLVGLQQITSGLLQGMGHTAVPLYNMAAAAVVKIILSWHLTAIPWLGEVGAAWATNADLAVATALNLYFARKYIAYRVQWGYIGKLFLAGAAMAGTAWLVHHALFVLFGNAVATIAAIMVAALVYLIGLVVFRALTAEDIEKIPVVGKKVSRRIHL